MTTSSTPALSTLIDNFAFYSRYSQVSGRPTNSRNDGKEWHGSCPRCGGHDRFSFWESGRFSCSLRSSGCNIHGSSPYWFLRDVEGLSHRQACDDLGIDPDQFSSHTEPVLPLFLTKDDPPPQKWQDAAEAFAYRAERYLWKKAPEQLEYLQSRGLAEPTIRSAHLGYCPGWYSESLPNWGLASEQTDEKEIKIPQGIIIPWFVDNRIWKLSVRRPEQGYFQVLGSSEALYNLDSLQPGKPAMLVESEIDTLSAQQEAGYLVAAIATGGASKGISARWIARLIQASHILISFDADQAGDSGAAEWLRLLPNSLRWAPLAKDVNAMLQSGPYIRPWIMFGLSIATNPPKLEQAQPELIQAQIEPITTPPALPYPLPVSSRSAYPAHQCKYCKLQAWIWYGADKEWICCECFSPARWSEK